MPKKGHATRLSEEGNAQEEQLQQHNVAADTGGGRPWQRRGLCTGGSSKAAREGGGNEENCGGRRRKTRESGAACRGCSGAKERPLVEVVTTAVAGTARLLAGGGELRPRRAAGGRPWSAGARGTDQQTT